MRRSFLLAGVAILLVIVGAGTWVYFYAKSLEPRAKQRVLEALQDRFDADVELKSLKLSIYPTPTLVGESLTIRHKQWSDPHPLIYIRRFVARTDFSSLVDRRNHVDFVRLEGLEVRIPARGRAALVQTKEQQHEVASAEPGHDTTHLRFLIERIVADNTLLEIEPKLASKPPLHFDIEKLTLRSAGPGEAMQFDTVLTNAKPPGRITSSGGFGPWQRDDPRSTPLSGDYSFRNGNLDVFKGISGTLSSSGSYKGVLQHIEIAGATDTPTFALKRGGEPVHLKTQFHSIVNGTDGDTILDPVNAQFLQSAFVCRGSIEHDGQSRGKTVSFYATTTHARIEDILRLILGKNKPVLEGAVDFKSHILIPPGHEDVIDKLQLRGEFSVSSADFTSPDVERRLETLSDRARGISKKEKGQQAPHMVASNFQSRFTLDHGATSFEDLSFKVPGAQLLLNGGYALQSGQINLQGQFRMQATLSETQSGVKSWMLKPFNRFFEKDGAGFELPIRISGTRDHPEIGTEIFHKHIAIH